MDNVVQAQFGKKPEPEEVKPKFVHREVVSMQIDVCCEKCDTYMARVPFEEQREIWQKAVTLHKPNDSVYTHRCPQCLHEALFPISYPTIGYRLKE